MEQENANKRSQRLRKTKPKLSKSLTEAKTRRSGGLLSAWISATIFSENYAAAGAEIEIGAWRGSG